MIMKHISFHFGFICYLESISFCGYNIIELPNEDGGGQPL